jgi:hypothetical protein
MDKVTFQAYSDFTAQSRTVAALMSMYANLERQSDVRMELTPIVVFLAFSIESYLNSIGARKIEIWDELERLPWKKKVSILHKTAKKDPDWGQDPLQFCTEIFKLRDKLAHGKPERVVGPVVEDQLEAHRLAVTSELQPEWYRSLTCEWAMKAKERFRLLMIYLGDLYGLHESDHLLSATGGVLRRDGEDA